VRREKDDKSTSSARNALLFGSREENKGKERSLEREEEKSLKKGASRLSKEEKERSALSLLLALRGRKGKKYSLCLSQRKGEELSLGSLRKGEPCFEKGAGSVSQKGKKPFSSHDRRARKPRKERACLAGRKIE